MGKTVNFALEFKKDLNKYLEKNYPKMTGFRILSKALDARGANRGKKPTYNYSVEILEDGEEFEKKEEVFPHLNFTGEKPLIVGAGPAGLFCALRLMEYGIPSIIVERGDRAHNRMKKIAEFWRYGKFDPENNVCYGEGGAGLFSDGKLITRIKSPFVQYVMDKLVEFGAPEDTAYLSNPHLGSNKIRLLINKISDDLTSKGCEIFYNTRMTKILTDETNNIKGIEVELPEDKGSKIIHSAEVVLATGHSAREIYHHLNDLKVDMKPKDFAVGVRIEHPRELIDHIQYGKYADNGELGAAKYRLSVHDKESDRGTYSFCMCPGGYVLSSGTDSEGIVVNGMSNFARNSRWSNSALVVSVKAGRDFPTDDVLGGLKFISDIEQKAFKKSKEMASGKELPAMTVTEFLKGKLSKNKLPVTSSPSGVFKCDFKEIFPEFILEHLRNGLLKFDKKMEGFATEKALLIAPETRTSAPVTILRDKISLESSSHPGLYPSGEGAGYAGGITSSAVDGIKVAESIIKK